MGMQAEDKKSQDGRAWIAWVRDNLKLILAAANAAVLLFLLYVLVSHGAFELRVRGLLERTAQASDMVKSPAEAARPQGRARPGGLRGPRPALPSARSGDGATSSGATSAVPSEISDRRGSTTSPAPLAPFGPLTTGPQESGSPTSATCGASATLTTAKLSQAPGSTPTRVSGRPTSATGGSTEGSVARRPFRPWRNGSRFFGPRGLDGPRRRVGADHRRPSASGEDAEKREIFAKLERRALFGGRRPTTKQPRLEAILGDAALINGKWVSVGERIGDVRLVEINADRVVIEDEGGRRRDLQVSGPSTGGPPRPGEIHRPPGGQPPEGQPSTEQEGGRPADEGSPRRRVEFRGERRPMPRIPDFVIERLTGPGGRFEGMSREEVIERLRELRERRRDRFRRPPRPMR